MSNVFKDIAKGVGNVERRFLGETYNYARQIKDPDEMRISPSGNMGQLSRNITGIISYINELIQGGGRASKPGRPLGNKFILETLGKCRDYKTNREVPRSMYINNIPDGYIPIVSDVSGFRTDSLRGLAPGIAANVAEMNPVRMFSAFMQGSEPLCAEVTLDTVGSDNRTRQKKGYIPLFELRQILNTKQLSDADKKRNPILRDQGKLNRLLEQSVEEETFLNMCDTWNGYKEQLNDPIKHKETNIVIKLYLLLFCFLLMYIYYKVTKK